MFDEYPQGAIYTHNGVTTYLGKDGTRCFVDHANGITKWLDAHGRITHLKSIEPIHNLEKACVAGIDMYGKPKPSLPIREEWTTYNSVGKVVRNDHGETRTYNYKGEIVGRILADGTRELLTYDVRGRHAQTVGLQADGETTYAIDFIYDIDGNLIRAVENREVKPPKPKHDHNSILFAPCAVNAILEETPVMAACPISEEQFSPKTIMESQGRCGEQRPQSGNNELTLKQEPIVKLELTPLWPASGLLSCDEELHLPLILRTPPFAQAPAQPQLQCSIASS